MGLPPFKSLLLEEKVAERKRGRMRCICCSNMKEDTSSVTFGDSFFSRRSLTSYIQPFGALYKFTF
jgi:hypothetical protein